MKASDLFVRCLEAEGVRRMFGVPGQANADCMAYFSAPAMASSSPSWSGPMGQ